MPTGEAQREIRVGDVVERDIDGNWFPAKVLAVHEGKTKRPESSRLPRQLAYDIIYLDDQNRESDVPDEDVRVVRDARRKDSLLLLGETRLDTAMPGEAKDSGEQEKAEGTERDEDEKQENSSDDEGPKVTIHSSHGTFDTKEDGSATAYIINGPETNIAAGSGLRGIRWLRGP